MGTTCTDSGAAVRVIHAESRTELTYGCAFSEGKIERYGLPVAHRHVLGLRPEFLVPGLDHIIPGREILDRVGTRFIRYAEKRMLGDSGPCQHPWMHIAFDADHYLGNAESLFALLSGGRHSEVERPRSE